LAALLYPKKQDNVNNLRYNTFVSAICLETSVPSRKIRNVIKVRLYPSKSQIKKLDFALDTCRLVYNSLLNDRKYQYEVNKISVTRYDQQAYLPVWKKSHPELSEVYAQVLQDVVHRVDLAFKAFFDQVKKGDTPGFPRMKGDSYDSLTYTQKVSFKIGVSSIHLAKIGQVKAKIHRKPWGEVKNCTIRRINSKWFACLCQEIESEPLSVSDKKIGMDAGLNTFLAFSDGTFVDNTLASAQRRLDKNKRGAKRKKCKKVVSRIHERIRNRRHNFLHQTARQIVNEFGVIALEKLNVKNMSKSPAPKPDTENPGDFLPNGASQKAGLNKSVLDASWSMFRSIITTKAESAGREVIAVNPAWTSQDCSVCGYRPDGKDGRTKKTLKDRWHFCPNCSASLDRDTNAAINILHLAIGQKPLWDYKASVKSVEAPCFSNGE
jgi:putative transposase